MVAARGSARGDTQRHVTIAPLLVPRHGSYGLSASLSFGRSSRARAVAAPARKSPAAAFVLSLTSTAGPMLAGAAMSGNGGADLFLGGLGIRPSVGPRFRGRDGSGGRTAA